MGLGHGAGIVRSGLVLHLDAANRKSYPGTGTTWTDLSDSDNNGTLVNGAAYNSTNNGSISFDGINDYITLPPLTAGNSEITVSMYIYPITTNGEYHIYTEGGIPGNALYWQFSITTRVWYTRDTSTGPTGARDNDISTNFLTLNRWNYITAVYSVSGGFKRFYVDGILKSSSTTSINALTTERNPNNAFIAFPTDGLYFNGNVSNVKLYNRALTQLEVQQNFEATRGRYGI